MSLVILLILIQLATNLRLTMNSKLKRNLTALRGGMGLNILAAVTMPFYFGYLIYNQSASNFLPATISATEIWDSPLTLRTLAIFVLTTFLPYLYFKYVCLSFLRDLSFHHQNRTRSLQKQKQAHKPIPAPAPPKGKPAKEKQRGTSFPQSRRPAKRRR